MTTGLQHAILIVDDDESFVRVATSWLQTVGLDYRVAATGYAGLHALSTRHFSAVLLDLRLPDMCGLDVLRIARGRERCPAVILISGNGSVRSVVEAIKLGAHDFLEKPVSKSDLLDTIGSCVSESQTDEIGTVVTEAARLVLSVVQSKTDLRTIADWTAYVHMSRAALITRFQRLDLRAKQALDLGRLLRVVAAAPSNEADALLQLDITDSRSLAAMLGRSGLRPTDLVTTPTRFLELQSIVSHKPLLREILRRLSISGSPATTC